MCECVSRGYRVNPQISHSGVSCKQWTMAKRTISLYFLPKPNDVEKRNPENESDSDCEETVVAKKGRNINFRDEWLREFTWLWYFRETNSMNCKFCCRYPQHAGNTKFADKTGTAQLKHDTLIKHNVRNKKCAATCAMKVQLHSQLHLEEKRLLTSAPRRQNCYWSLTQHLSLPKNCLLRNLKANLICKLAFKCTLVLYL